MDWDPGSGKNLHIPDPGSRGQKGTGSRIRIRNTGILESKLILTWIMVNRHRIPDPDPQHWHFGVKAYTYVDNGKYW